MKSILVFLRILIVGCLWGIVFTEGIRVIMLCNWHFDIFWPDHWHQFATTWRAGWFPRAPKEWAFIILIIVFFPMLITGWWTLCMVAWEDIIWNIIKLPYTLYMKYVRGYSPSSPVSVNNKYGVVKRKSYKLIRPAGINTLRVPISDYGNTATSSPIATPAASSFSSPYSAPTPTPASAPAAKKKTDVAATIDHALFKFDDDDDDDFDLDIDSFEKTEIGKKKPAETKNTRESSFDDEEEIESRPKRSKQRFDFDDDDEVESRPKRSRQHFDFDDDEDDENIDDDFDDEPKKSSRTAARRENKEKRRESRKTTEDSPRRNARSTRDTEEENTGRRRRNSDEKTTEQSRGPVYDALAQKNYEIISNVAVKDTLIDFVGVSEGDIYLCLVDKESGDWLADEEMFNGEEPLWFSENSHRVSPVCKLNKVRKSIEEALDEGGFDQRVTACVVIQMANIINADDMFEIWNGMKIEVTRINRGAPKEIKLFSKFLPEADGSVSKRNLDNLKKLFKSMK